MDFANKNTIYGASYAGGISTLGIILLIICLALSTSNAQNYFSIISHRAKDVSIINAAYSAADSTFKINPTESLRGNKRSYGLMEGANFVYLGNLIGNGQNKPEIDKPSTGILIWKKASGENVFFSGEIKSMNSHGLLVLSEKQYYIGDVSTGGGINTQFVPHGNGTLYEETCLGYACVTTGRWFNGALSIGDKKELRGNDIIFKNSSGCGTDIMTCRTIQDSINDLRENVSKLKEEIRQLTEEIIKLENELEILNDSLKEKNRLLDAFKNNPLLSNSKALYDGIQQFNGDFRSFLSNRSYEPDFDDYKDVFTGATFENYQRYKDNVKRFLNSDEIAGFSRSNCSVFGLPLSFFDQTYLSNNSLRRPGSGTRRFDPNIYLATFYNGSNKLQLVLYFFKEKGSNRNYKMFFLQIPQI